MLLSIIRKNHKLAAKRNPAYDRNRFAKYMIYFMVAFWAAYLVFIGVMLFFMFEGIFPNMEPYHMLNQGIIYLLILDFLLRFVAQPAMSQEVKPYLLMPVKKNKLIDTLLLQSAIQGFNFFWFFLIVPFALLCITRFYGLLGVGCYLLGVWMLMVLNSYWYLICKTLLNEKLLYILLPLAVYGLIGVAEFVPEGNPVSTFTMNLGEGFIFGSPLAYLTVLIAIALLFLINRKLQLHFIYNEIAKVEDTKMKRVSEYKFLDRYGDVGEYLRLELKLCLRNKTVKTQMRMALFIMIVFSLVLAFTDVYDGTGFVEFLCIYNYAIFGIMTLGQVMSFEGNYLDGLMSRKESIFNLLRAKYYVSCAILLIPFLFMLFPVHEGKFSLLMPVSYLFFTAGFVYAMLLQLAVYNKKTLPLNATVMKSNKGSSMFQTVIISCAFFVPLVISSILTTFCDEDTAFILMALMGIALIATHNLWIKNIYNRFMKRRYENMEGFRDSR